MGDCPQSLTGYLNCVTGRDARMTSEPWARESVDASLRDILERLDEEAGHLDKSDES